MSKVALVIGGTGGLGRACAEDLATIDYKVVVAGRNKTKGDDVVNTIKSKGGEGTFIPFDITDHQSVKTLHKTVLATYGRLDVAVNGAGITGLLAHKLGDHPPENVSDVLNNNLIGVIWSMQEQIKAMQANAGGSGGRIINFSSIYGLHGLKWGCLYAATKYALIGITKSAALEYSNQKDNILINCVNPGVILTELTKGLDPNVLPEGEFKEDMKQLMAGYPQQRFGDVKDVARGVRYLVESPWVTGTVLEIDGGFGAR